MQFQEVHKDSNTFLWPLKKSGRFLDAIQILTVFILMVFKDFYIKTENIGPFLYLRKKTNKMLLEGESGRERGGEGKGEGLSNRWRQKSGIYTSAAAPPIILST